MKKAQISRFKAIFFAVGIVAPLFVLSCSCGKSVQNNDIRHASVRMDSTSIDRSRDNRTHVRDSVYIRDSISVLVRGDTVYCDRWHTQYKYMSLDAASTDTLIRYVYKFTTDTLRVKETQYVYKDKPLTLWQQVRINVGGITIFLLLLIIIGVIVKLINHK